jgi:hypothetical protein
VKDERRSGDKPSTFIVHKLVFSVDKKQQYPVKHQLERQGRQYDFSTL